MTDRTNWISRLQCRLDGTTPMQPYCAIVMRRPFGAGGTVKGGGGGGAGAVVTVNVTGTLTNEAPVALSVIMPLWVPGLVTPVITLTITTPLFVPDVLLSVIHGTLSVVVQLSVPLPVLLMLRVCVAGLAPPSVAVKENPVGLAPMAG